MPTVGKSPALGACAIAWTMCPGDRALGDEGDEQSADTTSGDREPRRGEPHEEQHHEQAERGLVALRPADGLVARAEADGRVEPLVGRERENEERNARSGNPSDDGNDEVFGVCDRPCPDARERAAYQSDDKAADEVAQIERGTARRLEDAGRFRAARRT